MGHKEVTQGCQALSHPGAFVQQRSGLKERCEVHLHGFATERGEYVDGLLEAHLGVSIAKKLQMPGSRNAKAKMCRADVGCQVYLPCVRVSTVEPTDDLQHRCGVGHGERENRDAVQRLAGRYDTACTDQAAAGLQTHNVVQPGWYPTRAGRVGTQGKAHQPTRHRYR